MINLYNKCMTDRIKNTMHIVVSGETHESLIIEHPYAHRSESFR